MAVIRSRGNKNTELKLVMILRSARITGWQRHQPLPGRPDFVFRRERVAVFVDGCFWHGCPPHCRMPHTRTHYWGPKIATNTARNLVTNRALRAQGWRIVRIWEHSLRHRGRIRARLIAALASCRGTD